MRGNTISLKLQRGMVARTGNLFQYDYGQNLVLLGVDLPVSYEVHFSNEEHGNSKTSIGNSEGVVIPDEFLLSGEPIHVWLFLHDGEDDGETEYHGVIGVTKRAKPTDIQPTPVQQDVITQTISALNNAVEAIPGTIDTALAEAKASGEFDGRDGQDGADGHSPVVTANKVGKVTTVSVDGEAIATINDGTDGQDGQDGYTPIKGVDYFDGQDGKDGTDGVDGFSPTATVTKSGKVATITITDKNGTTSETVSDGSDGDPTALIDDTAGVGDTGKAWSANKSATENQNLLSAIQQKQDAPATAGTSGQVLGLDENLDPEWKTVSGGGTVDSSFSHSSENPLQNKVITNALLRSESYINIYTPQDIANIIDQQILQNGVPKSASWSVNYYISDYVAVTGGRTINFNFAPWGNADASLRAAEYSSNKTYIKNITSTTHTLSENAAYIRFSVYKSALGQAAAAVLDYINGNLLITDGTQTSGDSGIDESKNTFLSETSVRKQDTYFVDSSQTELLILWKMPGVDGKDVGIKIRSSANNSGLYFSSFGTVTNASKYVGNKSANYVEYMSSGEDWFSPMKVNAVNNIDGDSPDTLKWSGGLHRNNGVDTARRTKLEMYFDGRKNAGFVGYCKTIDIVVVHRNVASNTFKADGTGREVVEETTRIHFEGGVIKVETTVKALEPVNVYTWYFIQAQHKPNGLGEDGVRYIGGDANRSINSADAVSNSGDLNARVVRFLSDTIQLDMEIEPFDTGRFTHNSQSYGAFVSYYTTYSKAYFNAINNTSTPLALDTGESFTARGEYRLGIFE